MQIHVILLKICSHFGCKERTEAPFTDIVTTLLFYSFSSETPHNPESKSLGEYMISVKVRLLALYSTYDERSYELKSCPTKKKLGFPFLAKRLLSSQLLKKISPPTWRKKGRRDPSSIEYSASSLKVDTRPYRQALTIFA